VGKKEKTGKEPGNDLKEGKITLPLIYALKNAPSKKRKEVVTLLDEDFNQDGFEKVLLFIREEKGMEYACSQAEYHGDKALSNLSNLDGSECKQALVDLVNFAVRRDK